MSLTERKLQTLTEDFGFAEAIDMAEEYSTDGLCPCICMNEGCDHSEELEPDQDAGWCENCDTNTMKSAMVLMGVI